MDGLLLLGFFFNSCQSDLSVFFSLSLLGDGSTIFFFDWAIKPHSINQAELIQMNMTISKLCTSWDSLKVSTVEQIRNVFDDNSRIVFVSSP